MSVMKKWFPSKYLAADDIEENEVATIREIKDEAVGQAQEVKPVLYLEEHEKGIILNSTNAHALGDAFGEDDPYNDWPGERIVLFTEMTRNPQTRQSAPAIRMKPAPKKKAAEATAKNKTPPQDEAGDPGNWGEDEVAA